MLKSRKGFSLIELLVVIAIIGVLSAVGITAYSGYTADAKAKVTLAQHKQAVSFLNAESARCAQGTGNFSFTTSTACSSAWTVTIIADHVNASAGMDMNNSYTPANNFAVSASPATGQSLIAVSSGAATVTTTISDGVTETNTINRY